jgi:outer membrane protein OmpA-like peptidoglycan-associated protein
MHNRFFIAANVAILRRRCAMIALVVAALAIAGCKSAPPPIKHAPPPPSAAERRAQALEALGFNQDNEGWLLRLPDPIGFEFNTVKVNSETQHSLEGLADDLLKGDIRKLRIEGFSDSVGPRQINIDISRRRAEAVAQGFIAAGFDPHNIERIAMGPERPAASNATREGRARNRRVEIIVPESAILDP